MPVPTFSNGLVPTECWLATAGDPSGFTAQSGTSNRVLAPLAAAGTLLPTATPAGTACLRLNGGGYRAANLPAMSRRMWYAVCVKLTADGTFFGLGGNDWTLSVVNQNQRLVIGGSPGLSNCSPGQWGVYTGYCANAFALPFFNQMNFAGVNPAPADAVLAGQLDLPAFSGFWAGCMYGALPPQGYLDNQQHGELCQYFYQRVIFPGGTLPEVLAEANSLTGGISTTDADDVWPALVQDGLGGEAVVQSLACSSAYIDKMADGVQDRIDAAADPTRTQVIVYCEGTNGWMFSQVYGQNATALFNAELDLLRARRAANPRARIVFCTYPWRDSTVSGIAQNLFDAGRATYSGLADALATRATGHPYVKLAGPTNDAFHVLVQTHLIPGLQSYSAELWKSDRTHLTRAGQVLWADAIAYAVQIALTPAAVAAPLGQTVPLAWGLPPPAAQDIRLAAGEDITLAFAPLAGVDPADYGLAAAFACRHPLTGAVVLAADAGQFGDDADTGTFRVALAAADTAPLDPLLTYRWDVTRTDPGAVARLAHGRLLVAASQR